MKTLIFILCFFTTITAYAQSLEVDLKDIVGSLTGEVEIAPGVKLSKRGTDSERKYVRDYLSNLLKDAGIEPQDHVYKSGMSKGVNLYAMIPATVETNEYVLIGAHYDHPFGPGANDNATGVALTYVVAKNLMLQPMRNKNILIVFFDQEEDGLIGSKAFAKKMKDDGTNLTSVHTVDQMGWDQDGDEAIELEMPTKKLEEFYRCVANSYRYSMKLETTRTTSTDHDSFRKFGFNSIGITEEYVNNDTTPYYHQRNDTYKTVNFSYLEATTKFMIDTFAEITSNQFCRLD